MQSRDNDTVKEREQITIKYPRIRQAEEEEETHFHFILLLDESFEEKIQRM